MFFDDPLLRFLSSQEYCSSCAQVDVLEILLRDSLDLLDHLFIVEVSNNKDFAHKI